MTKPLVSYRRIERLKTIAFDRGFTNEDAKQFGKLSKTSTWEALLETYGTSLQGVDEVLDIVNSPSQSADTSESIDCGSSSARNFSHQNFSFLEWVDFGQLVALMLASAGVFVLAMSLWRQINPLNLFPSVRITIQIGQK